MTVFRKAVLERKSNNITGLLFEGAGKRKMNLILICMLIIVASLLLISQEKIDIYTTAKIAAHKTYESDDSCIMIEYEKKRNKHYSG